jgi:hypothetical protein
MADVSRLATGHGLMALCCLLYLAWWCIFFWPKPDGRGVDSPVLRGLGVVFILGAVAAGIASVVLLVTGSQVDSPAVSPLLIIVIAVVVYVALLFVTMTAFDRQPTTELVLFVAWAAFELSVLSALVGSASGTVGAGAVVYAVAIVVAFCVALVCYVLYYRLGPLPSFIDGCIPLILIGLVEAFLPAVTKMI